MLIFWSLVRNSVVLAVYLLFSVACFLTVHEHLRRAEQTAELFVDEGDPTGEQVGCGRRPSPIAGPEWLSRSDGTVLPPLAGAVA